MKDYKNSTVKPQINIGDILLGCCFVACIVLSIAVYFLMYAGN